MKLELVRCILIIIAENYCTIPSNVVLENGARRSIIADKQRFPCVPFVSRVSSLGAGRRHAAISSFKCHLQSAHLSVFFSVYGVSDSECGFRKPNQLSLPLHQTGVGQIICCEFTVILSPQDSCKCRKNSLFGDFYWSLLSQCQFYQNYLLQDF